jgi:sugar-specific transcriptional regulator TrmB
MKSVPPDSPETAAIDALETFGLSTYASETYLMLAKNGTSTAREVSENTTVPRTRVYDAVDELADLGVVETTPDSPKQFTALDLRRTSRRLGKEYDRRSAMLTLALLDIDELESETLTPDDMAEIVDGQVDYEKLFETIQHGLSEVRLFTLTRGHGEELSAVYLPGHDGAESELRLLSDFADGAVEK